MRTWLILGFVLVFNLMVSGQHYYSRNFTINNGLPSNAIKCIYKDYQNQMWIATGAGLCKFDGQKFSVYGVDDGLPGENIFSITEDGEHHLWIGCMKGGISRYDGKTFKNYTTKDGLVSDNVRVVWFSKRFNLLFVGTNDGCSVFDGQKFISLTTKESGTTDLFVMGFLEGADFVNIYPYAERPYYRFYPKTGEFKCIQDKYYITHNASCSPVVQPNGDTIIGSVRDGVNILNNGLKKSFKGMGQVFDIKRGLDKDIWIAGWSENAQSKDMPGGLYWYDGAEMVRYSEKFGIQDPTVWCLYYDTTFRLLWVGTLNSGLYKIPLPVFEYFDASDYNLDGLNVLSLLSTNGNDLWIGTKGHLIRRSPMGVVKVYNNGVAQQVMGDYELDYYCIRQDPNDRIYVSLYQSPLMVYSPIDNYQNPSVLKLYPGPTQFAFDTHDNIFYGDKWWDGIYKCSITPVVGKPVRLLFRERQSPTNVKKIISSGDTIWYISLTEGLFRTLHDKIDYFRQSNPDIPRILNDICFDRTGNVIIGSNTGEVLITRYEEDSLHIRYRLEPDKDIIGNTVRFLVVDKEGHLFVGTNIGLNRIDLKQLYMSGVVQSNFYSNEVGYWDNTGKVAECDKNGDIWIGTDSRLIKVNTTLMNGLNTTPPEIQLTRLEVNYSTDTGFQPEILRRFPYSKNNLIFHYGVSNYLNPEQILFRYKLDGLSDKWTEFSHENRAVFNSLPPGKYTLTVESINPLDNSRRGSISYTFKVLYPWYLNGWFIGFVIVIIILSIIIIFRLRTNRIRITEQRKTEFNKRLAKIEMRALQSQMNPHFIFNSINSIQGFIINNHVEEARSYLMDFAKLIRKTLDNATKEFITLEEELEYLNYYLKLELMRFDNKFQVDIQVSDGINPQTFELPPMIVQPYVENAIRHGLNHKKDGQGVLTIAFRIENDQFLRCIVEDNGVGRKKSKEIESWKKHTHQPQSTRITQDRIELLNLTSQSGEFRVNIIDLTDKTGTPMGTRVELLLPLRTI